MRWFLTRFAKVGFICLHGRKTCSTGNGYTSRWSESEHEPTNQSEITFVSDAGLVVRFHLLDVIYILVMSISIIVSKR